MTSRRLIRIKVLQAVYAFSKGNGLTLERCRVELNKSLDQGESLYLLLLMFLVEFRFIAAQKIDNRRQKLLPTKEDLHPNMRFVDNPVIEKLAKDKQFQKRLTDCGLYSTDYEDIIAHLAEAFFASEPYKQYMESTEETLSAHKAPLLAFFGEILPKDDEFYDEMEERSIYWNDDFELVTAMAYRTIQDIKPNAETVTLSQVFNAETREFAEVLLRHSILEIATSSELIDRFTENWELERIAEIDKMLMYLAIAEMKYCSSIPVKVTFDEYIEISKTYSTPKSGAFINGILDKVHEVLTEQGLVRKSGPGLL